MGLTCKLHDDHRWHIIDSGGADLGGYDTEDEAQKKMAELGDKETYEQPAEKNKAIDVRQREPVALQVVSKMLENPPQEGLEQDTTFNDINAGTSVSTVKSGGKTISVRTPNEEGQEKLDPEDVKRLKDLLEKEALEHGNMAKYSPAQLRQMLSKGQALRDGEGLPSFPIGDDEDLRDTIKAVGRGGSEHAPIRRYVAKRARAMGRNDWIPGSWSSGGMLNSEAPEALQQDALPQGQTSQPAGGPDENGYVIRDGQRVFDPDNDGDDDSTPDGDTDNDFWDQNGQPTPVGRRWGLGQSSPAAPGGMAGAPTSGAVVSEQMTSASQNDLPDSAFAYIEGGGTKDKSGRTMPRSKRHFPIHDKAHVRNALARASQSPFGSKAMPKIKAAAKRMGISVGQEEQPARLEVFLTMEGIIPRPLVQEQPTDDNGGRMKVRVPFYVGESTSRAPGFDQKVYFPKTLLPGVVQEGNDQIKEGRQPLTVYARHAHATSGLDLPVGKVVELEQEGRLGYATLEIAPTEGSTGGRNVQLLIQAGHLNAVSLRSGAGRFELEDKRVNGEPMLQASKLAIDGIDFAPDAPAMPTYGIEVLAAEATVSDLPRDFRGRSDRRGAKRMSEDLTLEVLRVEYPDLVQEVLKPIQADLQTAQQELKSVKDERDQLVAEKTTRERDEFIAELAAKFSEPDEARQVLAEMAADCKSRDDVERAVKPVMVLLERQLAAEEGRRREPEKNLQDRLEGLFRDSGKPMLSERKDEGTSLFSELPQVRVNGIDLPVPTS